MNPTTRIFALLVVASLAVIPAIGARGWTMDTSMATCDASFLGVAMDDQAGYGVRGVGDVDGDGLDDLLIGAPYGDGGAPDGGQAYLVLGRLAGWAQDSTLAAADASFLGVYDGDRAGHAVASAGDLDGDGLDDLLIGAPYNDDNAEDSGQVYIIMGRETGWALDTDLAWADASFVGEQAGDEAGFQAAAAGDVNGDGLGDLLICAAGFDAGSYAGQTYLVLGRPAGWFVGADLGVADASFVGEASLDYSGSALARAGDVDGDGFDDFLIGAYGNDEGGTAAGQAYLVLGRDTGWTQGLDLSLADASYIGELSEDRAGNAVSGAGDVNGDGFDDLLVGAYGNDDAGSGAGQTYLVLGRDTGWGSDVDLGLAEASYVGEVASDYSGSAVSAAGDVDGDGFDDFLIGAFGNDEAGSYAGQTYLVLGQELGWSMDVSLASAGGSFLGEAGMDWAGRSVAHGGDLNGDATGDFLIAAPSNDEAAAGAGQVYLWLGTPTCFDGDGDGYGDPGVHTCPGGADTDCDDLDAAINPSVAEVCDGLDNDCDGDVDEDDAADVSTWYLDADGDTYGDAAVNVVACYAPADHIADATDCDDADAAIHPAAVEACNGLDDNCDGAIDEGFDADLDGWSVCDGDCDDANGAVYPTAAELHDGIDNDCDGLYDEGAMPASALVITEVMADPTAVADSNGEWFEIYNTTAVLMNLVGLVVHDNALDEITVTTDLWIAPFDHLVLGNNASPSQNGGAEVDYEYPAIDFVLDNTDDVLVLEHDGIVIDNIQYGGALGWPDPTGASLSLDPGVYDASLNDDGDSWCETHAWPVYQLDAGDYATPGSLNPSCCVDEDGDGHTGEDCGGDDCDDTDPAIYPGAPEICDGIPDNDCDGVNDAMDYDVDGDGVTLCANDCDDTDATVYPGAPELCDGLDNDCDVSVDEDTTVDLDGDGLSACDGDCDDADANTHPFATELCDGLDNDCDGVPATYEADADGDGQMVCSGDCDDGDATRYIGATELCDGVDNDCDNVAAGEADIDGDGYLACAGDCDDGDPAVHPDVSEACNGLDDDCDGLPAPDEVDVDGDGQMVCAGDCDDSDPATYLGGAEVHCDGQDNDCNPLSGDDPDADGDGYTVCAGDCDDTDPLMNPVDNDGDGYTPCDGDCLDFSPAVNPGADEVCNGGLDDDCNAITDELADVDADGFSICDDDCDDSNPDVAPDADEVCDGLDNDCDPATDEEADADGDGFSICDGDCDDQEYAAQPGLAEFCDGLDNDCDGVLPMDEADADGDGWMVCDGDCDEADASVYPGAPEQCNGVDDDCDGTIDEDVVQDLDGDGFNPCQGDCDDGDATVYPGATEACDGVDTDCDGALPADEEDLDADGWSSCDGDCDDGDDSLTPADADGDGTSSCDGDCDDDDAGALPGGTEICDGVDNDCDGTVDDVDEDGDGHAPTECGGEDCDDGDAEIAPDAAEDCDDGADNDCDGAVDEDDDECGADDDTEDDDTDDDTVADDDTALGDDDGCECRSVAGQPGQIPSLLALGFAAVFARRRMARKSP